MAHCNFIEDFIWYAIWLSHRLHFVSIVIMGLPQISKWSGWLSKTPVFLGGINTNKSYILQKQKIIKCHMKGIMTFNIILFDNWKLHKINNTSNQVQSVEIIMNNKHESAYQQSWKPSSVSHSRWMQFNYSFSSRQKFKKIADFQVNFQCPMLTAFLSIWCTLQTEGKVLSVLKITIYLWIAYCICNRNKGTHSTKLGLIF